MIALAVCVTVSTLVSAKSSAALWSVLDSAPDASGLALSAQVQGREMHWSLTKGGTALASGDGALRAYVGNTGSPRFTGTASLAVDGVDRTVRFDAIGGLPMPLTPVRLLPLPGCPESGSSGPRRCRLHPR